MAFANQIPLKNLRKRSIPETDRQKNYGQASVLEPCPLNFTSYKKKTNNKSLKKTQACTKVLKSLIFKIYN